MKLILMNLALDTPQSYLLRIDGCAEHDKMVDGVIISEFQLKNFQDILKTSVQYFSIFKWTNTDKKCSQKKNVFRKKMFHYINVIVLLIIKI